jgi:hypothetical protein
MTIDVMIFTSPNLKGPYFWIYGSTLPIMVQHYYKNFEHTIHITDISNDTKRHLSQVDDLQNYNNTCASF